MHCRPSCAVLVVVAFVFLTAVADAQTRGQRAPAPTAKPAPAPTGWLGSPVREDPSPAIVSLRGVGTANAMAEARMTQQVLTEYCGENAQAYPSAAACLKQKQSEYGTRTFRASADCTLGRITTTGDRTYTLDGLWDATDIGAGRTRWRDEDGAVVERDLINNGLHISQQWETLCPAPVTAAFIGKVASQAAARPAAPTGTAPTPPICGGERLCTEVDDFAVTISDFRASLGAARKVLTATLRFENKSRRALVLGYVPASGVAIDERGNRYGSYDPDVRGIGLIGRTVDAKFVLQPGQRSDARFTYFWDAGRTVYGTTFDFELTVREIVDLGNNKVELGSEYPLRFAGLVDGIRPGTSAAPASSSAAPATAPPATGVAPAAAPVATGTNHCEGSRRPCYDAGSFSTTVAEFSGTVVGNRNHVLRINVDITNHTDQPLILAYKSSTNSGIDNQGNSYFWGRAGTYDGSVQGIGIMLPGRSVDTQFRLAPNQSRSAVFTVIRYNSGANPQGTTYAFDTVLAELRILPNGTQTETVREYSIHIPDLRLGAAAAPPAESIKKAGEAIRGLFGGKK